MPQTSLSQRQGNSEFRWNRTPKPGTVRRCFVNHPANDFRLETQAAFGSPILETGTTLRHLFSFGDFSAAMHFIGRHVEIVPFLYEAYFRIPEVFGIDTGLRIELFVDPEGSSQSLYVLIPTSRSVSEARRLRNRLDELWWLETATKFGGLVNVDIEYL
jgi:hypothetical protein